MQRRSRLAIALPDIKKFFDRHPQRIFSRSEISAILQENREFWRLAKATTVDGFITSLMKVTPLREVRLKFAYRPVIRYAWGEVGAFEIVQSINVNGYFCHYTAVYLHELTEQIPKTIYFNQEQRLTGGGGELTQGAINRVFKEKCRASSNTATYDDYTICLVSGRNTGQMGVVESGGSESLQITNLERTLIDITVRPIYAGGVFEVAKAFAAAKGQVSINRLCAYLKKLNYGYPYHQAIGFYLQHSGYKPQQVKLLRQFDIKFDFYLTYGMKQPEHNKDWRLFVPKGF